MPLRNSKAPESEVQDLLTSATKSERAMPLVPSLAGEHEDVVDGAGVGEPVPLDSDLAQSLAEGGKALVKALVKGAVSDAEDMCGLEVGGDDTVEHDEVLEGAAVGEPATLLGPPLHSPSLKGANAEDAEEGGADGGECHREDGDGYEVLGEVGGDGDAPAPATAKATPKHSEKQDILRHRQESLDINSL